MVSVRNYRDIYVAFMSDFNSLTTALLVTVAEAQPHDFLYLRYFLTGKHKLNRPRSSSNVENHMSDDYEI